MTAPAARILVVDDDPKLRDLLTRYLKEQGFAVEIAANGIEMDLRLSNIRIDLMVLDLMMPGEDGLSICRRLRAAGNRLPVIMLTAKGDEDERIAGLETGADDYLPKPFNPKELVARIQAVLRRQVRQTPDAEDAIHFGDYALHLSARRLTRQGVEVPLTTGEFDLLRALATHMDHPLSRDQLIEMSTSRDIDAFDRSIDVRVSRLRRLIEENPSQPRFIRTVWGFGYKFTIDGKE